MCTKYENLIMTVKAIFYIYLQAWLWFTCKQIKTVMVKDIFNYKQISRISQCALMAFETSDLKLKTAKNSD